MANLFDELNEMMALYRKRIEEEGEQALKDQFREFFQVHPGVKSVYWTQYTPYFNDGDACTFGVNEFYVTYRPEKELEEDEDFDEDKEEEEDFQWEQCHSYFMNSDDPVLSQLGEEINKLYSAPTDVFETVFGDHVKVTATREGFNVTDYNHD